MTRLIPFLFYQIPESYLLILSSLGLLGLRGKLGRLIFAGLGLGIITQLSRYYLFNFGLHTPVILFAHVIILLICFELPISIALTGCFLSYFLLKMGETILVVPIFSLTKTSFTDAINTPWLHVAFGWLSASFLVISVLICYIGRVPLIRITQIKYQEETKNE
ncbi:MAG: hypothetical protein K6T54_10630 [Ignavibacterium sp.]|nr:hypothetical protein [Ignavibacterium sp.]